MKYKKDKLSHIKEHIKEFTLAAVFDPRLTQIALIRNKRSPQQDIGKTDFWDGFMSEVNRDSDPSHKSCVLRDIKQEANLIVVPDDIFLIGCIKNENSFCSIWSATTKYPGDLAQTTDKPVEWFYLDNLPDLLNPDMQHIIPDAIKAYHRGFLGVPIDMKEYTR